MKYETLDQALAAMDKFQQTKAAYDHALGMIGLDAVTAAPHNSWEGRGKTMEIMSGITYELETNPEINLWLSYLEARQEELDPVRRR